MGARCSLNYLLTCIGIRGVMSETKLDNNLPSGIHCTNCGAEMLVKTNVKSGHQFLGCSTYPVCTTTTALTEAIVQRLTGAPDLFGVDPIGAVAEAEPVQVEACKHCGGGAVQKSKELDGKEWHMVVCRMCGIRTPLCNNSEAALRTWNRRPL